MIDLVREGDVFVLTMTAGENRWTTEFTRAMAAALDTVEASEGAAALITASADPKFFSNGLDLDWLSSDGVHAGGDRAVFGQEFMALMARIITFPMPTIAAVGGHGFGAGCMLALCHDLRVMREDRGYLCANEIELGMSIPDAELALFRHKLSAPVFHETVVLARRWAGPAALDAGIVQHLASADQVVSVATARAGELARLGANRTAMAQLKESLYGTKSAIQGEDGPAHRLRHR
ncbi:MAG: enoyl-CoA hydratase-related protein [Antricoccus sp.]